MTGRTTVDLLWIEGRTERWIRFGRIVQETIRSRSESTVGFDPGAVFAFVRWSSNDYGTVESRIDILRAVAPGERCSTVPHVTPGGEILRRCQTRKGAQIPYHVRLVAPAVAGGRSIKSRQKQAGWSLDYLHTIFETPVAQLGLGALSVL